MIAQIHGVEAVGKAQREQASKIDKVREASREFEAIFVRTLLRASPLGKSSGEYGEMALDGVARSVTAGRGLGLADVVAHAMTQAGSGSAVQAK